MSADKPQVSRSDLIKIACKASEKAVAPHSNFHVGAALEDSDGTVHYGCNIESDSYGLTICAERVALTKALSEGVRKFTRIAVIGHAKEDGGFSSNATLGPCGACRQLLWEHCGDIEVIGGTDSGSIGKVWMLSELLPDAFTSQKNAHH